MTKGTKFHKFSNMIGGPQIILIVMRGLGSGIKEFKKATKEDEEEDSKE